MSSIAAARPVGSTQVLTTLASICSSRELDGLAGELEILAELVGPAMLSLGEEIRKIAQRDNRVEHSAAHLLHAGGKRLRPMCVALASELGSGFNASVSDLAIAAELVHTATLLHDDVVDMGTTRRGADAARVIYGNAASIFAGDWLLIEALRRVRCAGSSELLGRLLETIEEMILAESLQLENRGKLNLDLDAYFRISEGKTAALFCWALYAGGHAGNLDSSSCEILAEYGLHLGVAFQAVDDALDLSGDPTATGKALFADLRDGKVTYPLILAVQRDPALEPMLVEILARGENVSLPPGLGARVLRSLAETGAITDCIHMAQERCDQAIACLERLPPSTARASLKTIAQAMVHRDR